MTFNNNLNDDYGSRGSTGGSGGGGGFGGGGNRGGGLITTLLFSIVGRKFGIPGLIVVAAIVFFMNGGFSMFGGDDSNKPQQQSQQDSTGFEHCKTAEDANRDDECRIVATQTSLDKFWSQALPEEAGIDFAQNEIVSVDGYITTGCGQANVDETGPFYCPSDHTVYTSPAFYKQLKQLGGSNGSFSQMYVTAHEVGHHIQNLQDTLGLSDYNNPGEDSNAVKLELQADCYAGLWASQADKGSDAVLDPVSQDQVDEAITTAQAIGDDHIQESSGQSVNSEKWTHGSSQQRADWFMRGYQGGTMDSCKQDFNK